MLKSLKTAAVLGAFAAAGFAQVASAAATLESVKEKGCVACGVNTGLPGFSNPDDKGQWSGLDVDVCRAVAAATLKDASKVKFVPLTAKERFTALQSGTTSELNLADYFRTNNMEYQPVVFDTSDGTAIGFDAGRCDVLTSDQSQLYALRVRLSKPDSAVVLPEVISKEPLGPVVRQGDDQWFNIVKWSLASMINGEELGLTSGNIKAQKASSDPNVRRLLGIDGPKGKGLALDDDWSLRIIEQVGNYEEIFERNVGAESPLQIDRGLNALWNEGGILYAPPFR